MKATLENVRGFLKDHGHTSPNNTRNGYWCDPVSNRIMHNKTMSICEDDGFADHSIIECICYVGSCYDEPSAQDTEQAKNDALAEPVSAPVRQKRKYRPRTRKVLYMSFVDWINSSGLRPVTKQELIQSFANMDPGTTCSKQELIESLYEDNKVHGKTIWALNNHELHDDIHLVFLPQET